MTTQPQIEFIAEEKERLTKAIRAAAVGIVTAWEALLKVADRTNKEWEPRETSVSDIAEQFAAALDNPDDVETVITAEAVAEAFSDPDDWTKCQVVTLTPEKEGNK